MASFWKGIFSRKTKTDLVRYPRRGIFRRGRVFIDEDSAMQVSAFNRGVTYVATQIAKLPWDIKDATNNPIEGPLSTLLSLSPNPEMSSFFFRILTVSNAIIHGNFYAEIERNTVGTPIALWPLNSREVEVLRTTKGDLTYRVTSNNANTPGGNSQVYLQPRDVYHIKNFHTKDGIVGQGVVAYAVETLGISLAADQMASGIFNNGGIPSGTLTHPGTLSDAAYARLKESWAEQHSGRKAGGTSILEEGTKYEAINTPPEALQFLESRQFGVLEIARFLGVPPTKLFDITAATYSNVENANLEVATDTLDSWAVNLEMEADIKLLNNRYGGRYTQLDLFSVFRADSKARADYFKAMMSIGAITPNQVRQMEGLPGYGAVGDNYYIATNNLTPVNRLNDVIDAEIAGKKSPKAPASSDAPKNQLEEAAVRYLNGK